jgi:hypothetical protein|tara:strand:+ start:333 stop:938 length:606 start_codon:yes stop_codon:yes gene_type:complete
MKILSTVLLGACLLSTLACGTFEPANHRNPDPVHAAIAPLFTPEQATTIIKEFTGTYTKLSAPKIDVRVNPPVGVPVAAAPLTPDELATQQTKREVERLFGRPLRLAGATLVDTDLSNQSEVTFEVLISARKLGGENSKSVPDIQVTAIRLADGSIIGQATVLDLFPNREVANRQLSKYSIQQLTQATALAVMRDISTTAK